MIRRLPLRIATFLLAGCGLAECARADTLWTENAENGAASVIDFTSPIYPLIQSDVVAEGNYAFHLAHPDGQDNWFAIDQALTMQATTKLFFLSRLRYASPTQIARVQISTNGGVSWPTTIYSQAGSNGPGEDVFSLKEINLGAYADQNLKFRFFYDLTPGSYYNTAESAVGWFIDNVQIGDSFAKDQWSIGDPSPHAQLYLEYVNRARANAVVEANRLRNETDINILNAYGFFGIEGQDIVDQFNWYVNNGAMHLTAQPLSFQAQLLQAAELHSLDQYQHQFQGHTSSSSPPAPFQPDGGLGARMNAVGYEYQNVSENVYASSLSPAFGQAGFDVDWGNLNRPEVPFYNPAFNDQGMQNPAGHRRTIHNDTFKEVGIGVVLGTNGPVGPQIVTQDFGYSGNVRYITGVVFDDANDNSFYDLGEGRSGVRVDVDGSSYYAISSTSGGYSVPVTHDGTFGVSFSGGGFLSFTASATITNGKNVKVDYLVIAATQLPGDYNNDGHVNAADYTVYRNRKAGIGGSSMPNDDTQGIGYDDYLRWKAHYGEPASGSSMSNDTANVPEPASLVLACLGCVAMFTSVRRPATRAERAVGHASSSRRH